MALYLKRFWGVSIQSWLRKDGAAILFNHIDLWIEESAPTWMETCTVKLARTAK